MKKIEFTKLNKFYGIPFRFYWVLYGFWGALFAGLNPFEGFRSVSTGATHFESASHL